MSFAVGQDSSNPAAGESARRLILFEDDVNQRACFDIAPYFTVHTLFSLRRGLPKPHNILHGKFHIFPAHITADRKILRQAVN